MIVPGGNHCEVMLTVAGSRFLICVYKAQERGRYYYQVWGGLGLTVAQSRLGAGVKLPLKCAQAALWKAAKEARP